MPRTPWLPLAVLAGILALSDCRLSSGSPERPISFRSEVAPILVRACLGCHQPGKTSNGLDLSTFARLRRGGKASGAEILVAGDPQASMLYTSILADASPRMPYKAAPLSEQEIQLIGQWIQRGAEYDGPPGGNTVLTALFDPLRVLPKPKLRQGKPTARVPVSAVSFSPDGRRLAVAIGNEVRIFDLEQKKPPQVWNDHDGPVNALGFTPDGSRLIAGGGRPGMFGSVVVRDLASGKRLAEARGHSDAIQTLDLARDGSLLATGSHDRLVRLWDPNSLAVVRELREHTDAVNAVAFSPNGGLLASAGSDRAVKLWRVRDGARISSSSESTGEVYSLVFASPERLLAAGVDRSIRSWNLDGEKPATPGKSTFAHDAPVLRLVSAKSGVVYSAGEDRAIRLWDASSFAPKGSWIEQSDWPQAIDVDHEGKRVAVGRHDGSLAVLDASSGRSILTLIDPAEAPKIAARPPTLFRPATLAPPAPRALVRGSTTRVVLTGNGVDATHRILLPEPGLSARIVDSTKPAPNRLEIDLTVDANARVGLHRIGVQTPLGIPSYQELLISEFPTIEEAEPNDEVSLGKAMQLPSTVAGTIEKPGDVDLVRFDLKQGDSIEAVVHARTLGSKLSARLEILDETSKRIAVAESNADDPDPALSFRAMKSGIHHLRIGDMDYGAGAGHFYRVDLSRSPQARSIFPLGITSGTKREIEVRGTNLPGDRATVTFGPANRVGDRIGSPIASRRGLAAVVAEGEQSIEHENNDSPNQANGVDFPGGVSGRIQSPGDVDFYAFPAKRGRRMILEVFARRLGTSVDPVIEIVDSRGEPVPRALLRPIEQTNVAFRDHASLSRSIRLTTWDHLAVGDSLLVGREVVKLSELPRNPDDDAVFFGLGIARISPGERIGLLETTPEQHPQGRPMFKVEIHPPDAKLPVGGMAPVLLPYRNDDGGPSYGKDSRITFDPPSDGTFYLRVEDVRALGGPDHGYHLVVREPRPDFTVDLSPENPNVPRGGSAIVTASLTRIDGFDRAVDLVVEDLPEGLTATRTRIEPDAFVAEFLISADDSAPAFSEPTWKVRATANSKEGRDQPITRVVDPGGSSGGWITVTEQADLTVKAGPSPVEIRAGERVEMRLEVDRGAAFQGRVPIDVRNLPLGVRVLYIGLNGVLVTEAEKARSIFLYAEPWTTPGERMIFAVGKVESAGTLAPSAPVRLVVSPAGRADAAVAKPDPKK